MSKKWKPPEGFVLTKHPGYYIDHRGFALDKKPSDADIAAGRLMPDGHQGVSWFNEDEPFIAAEKDGVEGYSPNVQVLPIVDGWVPPVYTLHTKEEAP